MAVYVLPKQQLYQWTRVLSVRRLKYCFFYKIRICRNRRVWRHNVIVSFYIDYTSWLTRIFHILVYSLNPLRRAHAIQCNIIMVLCKRGRSRNRAAEVFAAFYASSSPSSKLDKRHSNTGAPDRTSKFHRGGGPTRLQIGLGLLTFELDSISGPEEPRVTNTNLYRSDTSGLFKCPEWRLRVSIRLIHVPSKGETVVCRFGKN